MLALIWDMDDTLYSLMQPFERACEALLGSPLENPREVYERFRVRSDEVFEASERGEISLEESRIQRFKKAMEDCGIQVSREKASEFQENYKNNTLAINLSREMEEFLTFCKEGDVKLGMITNGPTDHQMSKIHALGLHRWIREENIFISGTIGFMKPDPRIYNIAGEKLGLVPSDTYMIGDKLATDIEGAKRVGWKTIWFNRRNGELPGDEEKPTFIVNDEAQLLELLYGLLR